MRRRSLSYDSRRGPHRHRHIRRKDSVALLAGMSALRRFYPARFELTAVNKADGVMEAYIRVGNESVIAPDYIVNELILKGTRSTPASVGLKQTIPPLSSCAASWKSPTGCGARSSAKLSLKRVKKKIRAACAPGCGAACCTMKRRRPDAIKSPSATTWMMRRKR